MGAGGDEVAAELDSSGNIVTRFVRGDGDDELVASYVGSGTGSRTWYREDERGSVIAFSGASGATPSIYRYDEYGVPMVSQTGRFQYTGQMRLNEAGIYNYKARNMLAELGGFTEPDPVGYDAGMNRYAYVLDDPVNGTDPSGEAVTLKVYCGGTACTFGPDAPQPVIDPFAIIVNGRRDANSRCQTWSDCILPRPVDFGMDLPAPRIPDPSSETARNPKAKQRSVPPRRSWLRTLCPNSQHINWNSVGNRTLQGFGIGFANGLRKVGSRWEFYALAGASVGSVEPGGGTVTGAIGGVIGGAAKDVVGGAILGSLTGATIGIARQCRK